MKKYLKIAILSIFFSFFCSIKVYATDASPSVSGGGTIESGKTFTVDLYANNVGDSQIMSVGGSVSSANNSCVQFVSVAIPNNEGVANNTTFAWSNMGGKKGSVKVATATFKAIGNACSSTINFSGLEFSFTDGTKLNKGTASKAINVVTYSTNNNLSSLTVSTGNLNPGFSASQTNYTVNVGSDIANINIGATAEDAKAQVTGTGSKNLNFGSNKFAISVKAENGATKVYNINVIRQDNRSSDANLKSLTVNGGSLSPRFDSGTTEYSLSVPYSVSKLNINAQPSDSTSKVSINNPDLIAEATTNVTIRVTAENGASKTYVIKVNRGKDPNKKLNTDNNLLKLVPNIGILSPEFNQEKTNYFIYLPYEVDSIDFSYEVSDTRYATVDKKGPDKLKPDSGNKYTFAVKAEDESIKTYSVTVYRAKNPEELGGATNNIEESSKPLLKDIKLKNGNLIGEFNPETNTYKYTKNKDFSYEYILEDENTYATVVEQDSNIFIILESENGEMNVYCLHEKEQVKKNYFVIILLIIIIIILLAVITLLFMKVRQLLSGEDKPKKKSKKTKK